MLKHDEKKHYSYFWTYGVGGNYRSNNVIEQISTNSSGWESVYTAFYEYNEVGLPMKRVGTSSNGSVSEIIYEYERR